MSDIFIISKKVSYGELFEQFLVSIAAVPCYFKRLSARERNVNNKILNLLIFSVNLSNPFQEFSFSYMSSVTSTATLSIAGSNRDIKQTNQDETTSQNILGLLNTSNVFVENKRSTCLSVVGSQIPCKTEESYMSYSQNPTYIPWASFRLQFMVLVESKDNYKPFQTFRNRPNSPK